MKQNLGMKYETQTMINQNITFKKIIRSLV